MKLRSITQKYGRKLAPVAGLTTVALVSPAANAAIDISAAVTAFETDVATAIGLIGVAMITLAGISVTYKWAKATFFG